MERYQKQAIIRDLHKKMVLLAGPRQSGKTTLAKAIMQEFTSSIYLTYDRALVIGSARLEALNQIGDSLAGRYFLHRLLPLSPAECDKVNVKYTIDHFLERGRFPEPFLATDAIDASRLFIYKEQIFH